LLNPNSIKRKDLRNFALIWTFIFTVISVFPLIKGEGELRLRAIIVAAAFLIIGLFIPNILKYFYIYWVKFGEIMGNIVSKVILTLLFFIVFFPVGLVFRLMGKDLLSKKLDKNTNSYWINREIQPGSMENQF